MTDGSFSETVIVVAIIVVIVVVFESPFSSCLPEAGWIKKIK